MFKNVPPSVDACPAVVAALARYNELKASESRLDTELTRLIDEANAASAGKPVAGTTEKIHNRQLGRIRDELASARQQVADARNVLDKARGAASMAIAESRKPEYVAIVRETKEKINALQAVMAKELAFRHRLEDAGSGMGNGVLVPLNPGRDFDGWLGSAKLHYGI